MSISYRAFDHWQRLGASFGGRGRRVSAENFFWRPQKMQKKIFGDSLSLWTKCCLSNTVY